MVDSNEMSAREERVAMPTINCHPGHQSLPKALGLIRLSDENLDKPLHERIYRQLRALILSGTVPQGSRFASSRLLAQHVGVSRNTILTAIGRLVADGLLEARICSGVFVSYSGPQTCKAAVVSRVPSEATPFEWGARALDLFPTQLWRRLQSRRWKSMSGAALQPGDALGWPPLREAIAAHAASTRGLESLPENVLITTSQPAAVDLAVRALGLSGSDALVEDPGYHGTRQSLENSGVRLIPVPVDASGLEVEYAVRAAPNAKLAVVTPACQFPTCVTMTKERRGQLLRWAELHDAWIIEYDYDWHSDSLKNVPRPLAAIDKSRTIYVNSFNPTLFPALRIAYAVCPAGLLDSFAAVRIGLDGHSNVPNQIVLTDFINGGHLDEHLRRLSAAYPERRAALIGAIERELAVYASPEKRLAGTQAVVTLREHTQDRFIALCKANGVTIDGMNKFRLISSDTEQVVLHFSGFSPSVIVTAVETMRRAIQTD